MEKKFYNHIAEYSEKYLEQLLLYKQRNPSFTFWLRQEDNALNGEPRLSRGFWFLGSSYISIGLVKKGDNNNKTRSISFLTTFGSSSVPTTCLEVVWGSDNNSAPQLVEFYENLCKVFELLPDKKKATRRTKLYQTEDPLKNLEEFLLNDKPIIERLITQFGLEREFLITEEDFMQSLQKIARFRKDLYQVETPFVSPGPGPEEKEKKETSSRKKDKESHYTFSSQLHCDLDLEDKLDHKLFATAIAEIIKSEKTHPPVNIAIIAPWGHGKTTLMKFIREQFEKRDDWEPETPKGFHTTVSKLLERLKDFASSADKKVDPIHEVIRTKPKEYPTIWFNPWKYQSSEQVWAGIGHAIITQLVSKYTPLERELIWLRLRAKRVDTDAIRKEIHKRILNTCWPLMLGSFSLGLVLFILASNTASKFLSSVIGVGAPFLTWLWNRLQAFNKTVDGKFADYVKEPDYTSKLGIYHEINEDLNIVCQELINPAKPAIIFIDDLDRCSPKTVAQVFEAINLMVSGELRDRCYFVLGMDAQIVAASLDTYYSDWAGRLPGHEKIHGSVGWYFLDKFIQLPFFVPVLNPKSKKNFLASLFEAKGQANGTPKTKAKSDAEIEDIAENIIQKPGQTNYASEAHAHEKKQLQKIKQAVVKKSIERSADSPEIIEVINRFSDYLDNSPRGMKRFANLLRFYDSQRQVRAAFAAAEEREKIQDLETLAKWLVIIIRWPQMVRWLQWEREESIIFTNDPELKAKMIDELIEKIPKSQNPYDTWNKELKNLEIDEKKHALKWLYDRDLFYLLNNNKYPHATLEMALKCDIW